MNLETQKLINHCKETAKELIEDTDDFNPFAAYIDSEGILIPLEYEGNKKENPLSGEVIESLKEACDDKMLNENGAAYGLVYEVKMQLDIDSPSIDAIAIDIVNPADKNVPIYYFQFSFQDKKIKFSELFAVTRGTEN